MVFSGCHKLPFMGKAEGDRVSDEVLKQEFIGGAYSSYRVKAGPPWIRLVITPEQVEFHARGLARLIGGGPWAIPRRQVKRVFAKRRRNFFPHQDPPACPRSQAKVTGPLVSHEESAIGTPNETIFGR